MAESLGDMTVLGAVRGGFARWLAALPRVWTVVVACGALTAGASFAMVRLAEANVGLYLLSELLFVAIFAYAYAAQLAASLGTTRDPRRAVFDGGRVLAGMSAIAFFLFLLFFAAMIPGAVILTAAVQLTPVQLEAAQRDPAAAMQLAERIARTHPQLMLGLALAYAVLWMYVTSRLYLAAPATVTSGRIHSFNTWPWTKGAVWRIAAARLVLLLPVWAALTGLQAAVSVALGMPAFDPGAMQALMMNQPLIYLALLAPMHALSLLVYTGLEAGLSAHLHDGLKRAPAVTA